MQETPTQILAVDDDGDILALLQALIEAAGGTPVCFSSAQLASEYLSQHKKFVCLILSDYNMPETNGLSFRANAFEIAPDVPFIFLSGYITDEMRSMTEQLGVTAFIDKPFDFSAVQDLLRRELSSHIQKLEFASLSEKGRLDEAERGVDELLAILIRSEADAAENTPRNLREVNEIVSRLRVLFTELGSQVAIGLCQSVEGILSPPSNEESGFQSSGARGAGVWVYLIKVSTHLQNCLWSLKKQAGSSLDLTSLARRIDGLRVNSSSKSPTPMLEKGAGDEGGPHVENEVQKSKIEAKGESIRIPTVILDEFIELAGENTVLRNMVNRLVKAIEHELPGSRNVSMLAELLGEMYKTNSRMHTSIELMRKVPVGHVWRVFPRTIRDLSAQLGKQVSFEPMGDDLLIDSSISNALGDCLVHLLRNSLDHGLELPSDRVRSGKPPSGVITLKATIVDEELRLVLADDGRGIDAQRIGEKAIEKGLATTAQIGSMTRDRIIAFVFEPGFSTAAAVTDVSGRGVGMDFVRSTLEGLGGRVSIDTVLGKGTTFTLTVPEPKAVRILNALMIQADGHLFALPQSNVESVQVIHAAKRKELVQEFRGSLVFRSRGLLLSLIDIRKVFRKRANGSIDQGTSFGEEEDLQVIIVRGDSSVFAIIVDDIVSSEEIVVKPLPEHLAHMEIYLGVTFLGVDGVCPVFSAEGMAKMFGIICPDKSEYNSARNGLFPDGMSEAHLDARRDVEILTFYLGGREAYGVQVSFVFRLEEISPASIRYQLGSPVLVYRGMNIPALFLEKVLSPRVSPNFDARKWIAEQPVLSVIVVEVCGSKYALVVRAIGEYQLPPNPVNRSLKRGDFQGSVDVVGRLVTLLDLTRLLERLGFIEPTVDSFPDALPRPSAQKPEGVAEEAFDANGIREDDGIVWVNVG